MDSEPLTNRVIAEMIREYDIEITTEQCLDLFAGKTMGHITQFIKDHGKELSEDQFEKSYRSRCTDVFKSDLRAIPGVEELIRSLSIDYCVASNGPKVKMKETLPAAGLDSYFVDRTYSAYDVQKWKPEPDLFLHVCEDRKCSPTDALVLEDTWSGMMGAINAGIDVWAYNPHYDTRTYLDGVPNFSEMSAVRQFISLYI